MREILKLALKNIQRRKLRSLLTTIGVTIGIGAINYFLILSKSLEYGIINTFESLGKDKLIILPGKRVGFSFSTGWYFSKSIVNSIEHLPSIKYVIPGKFVTSTIEHKNKQLNVVIYGFPLDKMRLLTQLGYNLREGRFPSNNKECVVGYGVYKDLSIEIGDKISNKFKCKVVGILEQIGSQREDYTLIVSENVLEKHYNLNQYNFIFAIAKDIDLAKKSYRNC